MFVGEPYLVELLGGVGQGGVDQSAVGLGCEQAAIEHQEANKRTDAVLPAFQNQIPKPQFIPKGTLHIVGPERDADALLIDNAIKATESPFAALHLGDLLGL